MRRVLSLRSRLLLGAVLWTIGLFTMTSVVMTHLVFLRPAVPHFFHNLLLHFTALTIIAVVCMLVGFWQVRVGLSPVTQLRSRLADVHAGREPRVEGRYPAEVEPLVRDLNALLEQREDMVRRAHAKAGDLAHGLKTPLAVLANEAERAAAAGHDELATLIGQQVDRMRRQVEYHLAHARAAASGAAAGSRCQIGESAEALARTLRRLYAERGLVIDVQVALDHTVRAQREDLDEMLGNLLDNACKWARTRVSVSSAVEGTRIVIAVDDDGIGIDPSQREAVLQRGVRADEAAPGSGFGLAIVRELTELYGGSISLAPSPLGGVRARLELPSASAT